MAAAIARAIPVLPLVASIRVSPGLICPLASAREIMLRAGRSLTEPAGLLPSSLARMVLVVSPGILCRRTRGVLPMVLSMVGKSITFTIHNKAVILVCGAGLVATAPMAAKTFWIEHH